MDLPVYRKEVVTVWSKAVLIPMASHEQSPSPHIYLFDVHNTCRLVFIWTCIE